MLSGGLDSTVLATELVRRGAAVQAVSVHYGQRHAVELEAAAVVASRLGIPHDIIDLSVLRHHLRSALTGTGEIPHGHYAADTMSATVVPNRNAIMLMVACGVASARGLRVVATAVHSGDHPIYPDCRPEFIAAATLTAMLGTETVRVEAPYIRLTKAEIAAKGVQFDAPMELSWSCYEGGDSTGRHCGRCGTCVERAEAFHLAGVRDPTDYADTAFWREQVTV
nr:7-cyano-7-deazaguanine synthase QueC [Kibdelosporangium phytohabitans]